MIYRALQLESNFLKRTCQSDFKQYFLLCELKNTILNFNMCIINSCKWIFKNILNFIQNNRRKTSKYSYPLTKKISNGWCNAYLCDYVCYTIIISSGERIYHANMSYKIILTIFLLLMFLIYNGCWSWKCLAENW